MFARPHDGESLFKLRHVLAKILVEDALRIFIARNMPDEAPAVLADLSMMATPRWDAEYPDRTMVIDVLNKFEAAVASLSLRPEIESCIAGVRNAS